MIEATITKLIGDTGFIAIPIGTNRPINVSLGSYIHNGIKDRTFFKVIVGKTCYIAKDRNTNSYVLLGTTLSACNEVYLQAKNDITINSSEGSLDIKAGEQTLKDILMQIQSVLNKMSTATIPTMAPSMLGTINPSIGEDISGINTKINALLK